MIFEIPLKDGSSVFMKGTSNNCECVIIVNSLEFLTIWRKSQRDDNKYSSINGQKKWKGASDCFKQSSVYPVHLPSMGHPIEFEIGHPTMELSDGVTRIHWLLHHGVKEFPIYCPILSLATVKGLISVKLM